MLYKKILQNNFPHNLFFPIVEKYCQNYIQISLRNFLNVPKKKNFYNKAILKTLLVSRRPDFDVGSVGRNFILPPTQTPGAF